MSDFQKRFWRTFPTLATIVAFAFAAAAAKVLWAFWLVLVASLLFASFKSWVPKLLDGYSRIRNYNRVLEQLFQVRQERDDATTERDSLGQQVAKAYEAGFDEGKRVLLGGARAVSVGEIPTLSHMANDSGAVVLFARIASVASPEVGARWDVGIRGTKSRKGSVQLSEVDPDSKLLVLTCVDRTVPEFWNHLDVRAVSDPDIPEGVELRPSDSSLPPTLELEVTAHKELP